MATTYTPVLRRPRKDGLCPVHLRFTSDRVPRYRAVDDMALSPAHWNANGNLEKANWVRKTHPSAAQFNARLQVLMSRAQDVLTKHPHFDAEQLRAAVATDPTEGPDLLAYLRRDVARRAAIGHPRTAQKFESIHNKLQSFLLGVPHPRGRLLAAEPEETKAKRAQVRLPFAQFTVRRVRDYEHYLAGLGNRTTTIQKEMSFLNTVLLRAVEDGELAKDDNPFGKMTLAHGKARPKAKLSDAEVAQLEALTPEALGRPPRQGVNHSNRSGRLVARDTWLLQFFLLGSRVGDALTLRWRDVGPDAITFTEHKTGKLKVVPRHAGLDALLLRQQPEGGARPEDFVLPYLRADQWYAQFPAGLEWSALARMPEYRAKWSRLLQKIESATASVNGNLKQVAALAGVDKPLTTHTARHSFADRGRRLGVSASDMRDLLNHHSISQTEEYFGQLERSEINDKARTIYAAG